MTLLLAYTYRLHLLLISIVNEDRKKITSPRKRGILFTRQNSARVSATVMSLRQSGNNNKSIQALKKV